MKRTAFLKSLAALVAVPFVPKMVEAEKEVTPVSTSKPMLNSERPQSPSGGILALDQNADPELFLYNGKDYWATVIAYNIKSNP